MNTIKYIGEVIFDIVILTFFVTIIGWACLIDFCEWFKKLFNLYLHSSSLLCFQPRCWL